MNKRALWADLLLLLTACIWGFGFVAQRSGMEYIGPFAYNGIRFLLGSVSLFPLVSLRSRRRGGFARVMANSRAASLLAGSCCFVAVTFQQLGLMFTTAGNAGFITGLYVVLTPIIGMALGRKTGPATWLGAVFTLAGLYCIAGKLSGLNPGDALVAAGAVFWTFHVLIIDFQVKKNDPIALSSGQFMACGLLSLIAAFLAEPFLAEQLAAGGQAGGIAAQGLFAWVPLPGLLGSIRAGTVPPGLASGALVPILYGGIASVGIAYTLQVVAQRDAPPAHATIILCLEGCFAALGGIILLSEPVGPRTILGFALMLLGMLVSQWEVIRRPSIPTD